MVPDGALADRPQPEDQRALALRVASGDAHAAEEFARLYRPRVLCVIRARLREWEVAGELADDSLMAALAAVRGGRLAHADRLSAFVCGVARNVANSYLRTRSRRPHEVPLEPWMATRDPVNDHEEAERLACVRRAIAELEETDRRVLEMTLSDGLKPGEIASRLGLSAEVVRARKSRALRKVIDAVRPPSRTGGPAPP